MLVERPLCFTSTIGDSAVTVTDSRSRVASCRLNSTLLIEPSLTSTSPTFAGLKPARFALTSYVPGSTDGKRKFRCSSVVAVSTPLPPLSASTVTPGSTPPDASLTTPSISAALFLGRDRPGKQRYREQRRESLQTHESILLVTAKPRRPGNALTPMAISDQDATARAVPGPV